MDKRVYTKKLRLLKNEVDKMMLQEAYGGQFDLGGLFHQILDTMGKSNITPEMKIDLLRELAREHNLEAVNQNIFTSTVNAAVKVKSDELTKQLFKGISEAKNSGYNAGLEDGIKQGIEAAKEAAKEGAKKATDAAIKIAGKEEWKKGALVGAGAGSAFTAASAFLTVAVTGTAVVAGSVILNKWRTSSGLKKVKSLYNKANNSDSYKEASKYINALTKIRDDNGLWNRLTRSNSVKTAAGSAVETLKKSYISLGVAMILLSAVLCVVSASSMNIVQPMVEAAKNLDWKQLLISVGKILAIGVMAIPAFIGVCLIVLALKNFPPKGFIADFIEYTAPAVNTARLALDEAINTLKTQIG